MARRSARQASDGASRDEALLLGAKLVGLACEQRDAVKRGAAAQFSWLALRRDEVTAQLRRLASRGTGLDDEASARMDGWSRELQLIDEQTSAYIRSQLKTLTVSRATLQRFHRSVAPYLSAAPRVPSFVDKKS